MQIGLLAEISDHRKVVEQVAEQDEKLTQHWQSQVDKFGEIANAMRKTWHLLKSQTAMKQIVFDNPGTGSTLESHLQLPYIRYGLSAKVKKLNCSLCGSPRGSAPTRTDSKGLRPDDAVLLLQRDVSV